MLRLVLKSELSTKSETSIYKAILKTVRVFGVLILRGGHAELSQIKITETFESISLRQITGTSQIIPFTTILKSPQLVQWYQLTVKDSV